VVESLAHKLVQPIPPMQQDRVTQNQSGAHSSPAAPAGAGPRTGSACSQGRSSCTGPGRAGSASPGPIAPRPGSGPHASTGTCRTRCRARCTARRGTRTRSPPRPPTCACRRAAAPSAVLGAAGAARCACEQGRPAACRRAAAVQARAAATTPQRAWTAGSCAPPAGCSLVAALHAQARLQKWHVRQAQPRLPGPCTAAHFSRCRGAWYGARASKRSTRRTCSGPYDSLGQQRPAEVWHVYVTTFRRFSAVLSSTSR